MGICRYCALAPAACGREPTDLPLPPFLPLRLLFPSARRSRAPVPPGPSGRASRRPDHVSSPVCHPIFRSYHDMPEARWIPFIGVRVCPTSIYRRGVPRTGYSQRHKEGPFLRSLSPSEKFSRRGEEEGSSARISRRSGPFAEKHRGRMGEDFIPELVSLSATRGNQQDSTERPTQFAARYAAR